MRQLWRRKRDEKPEAATSDASRPAGKLAGARQLHIDPDDDRPTAQDKEAEKAARRAGGSGGGPAM